MTEKIIEPVKTGALERLQPWQALFGILTYVIGAFDISEWQVLVLCGFLLIALGFTQRTNYKHKEAIKEVVAPWLIEKVLAILEDYVPKDGAHEHKEEPILAPPVDELEKLKLQIEELSRDG